MKIRLMHLQSEPRINLLEAATVFVLHVILWADFISRFLVLKLCRNKLDYNELIK